MLLKDKVAIVTGAGQGIGLEYAKALAREGASVGIAEINAEQGKAAAAAIEADDGQAVFAHTDVSDPDSTRTMAATITEAFGGIDLLVNNAAMYAGLPYESIGDMPVERFDKVMAVNVKGVWLTTRAVLPHMCSRGGGSIVNQGSLAGYLGTPNRLHYVTSKAAVFAMTRALAKELAPNSIRVNALAPGAIGTDATLEGVPKTVLEGLAEKQLIKRMGTESDLTGPLVFLLSEMSAFMTGQVLVADGGTYFLG